MSTRRQHDRRPTTAGTPATRGANRVANRARILGRARERAVRLAPRFPDEATTRRAETAGRPALSKVLGECRARLAVAADPTTSDWVLLSTLAEIDRLVIDYQSSSEASGNDSDCTRGCQENLQTCVREWVEIAGSAGSDFPVADVDPWQDAETQDPGGGAGSIDDNPLDVENNDPGDTGGSDDGDHGPTVIGGMIAAIGGGLCGLEYAMCLASCVFPG